MPRRGLFQAQLNDFANASTLDFAAKLFGHTQQTFKQTG